MVDCYGRGHPIALARKAFQCFQLVNNKGIFDKAGNNALFVQFLQGTGKGTTVHAQQVCQFLLGYKGPQRSALIFLGQGKNELGYLVLYVA